MMNEYNPVKRQRIGGSQVAAIFGVHDFLTEFGFYLQLHGELPPEDANDRMRFGKHMEQGIASYAAEIEGWDYIWCDRTVYSIVYPFMVYTVDGLIPGKRWGFDCKVVFPDQAHRWGKSADRIPDHAVMQGWWYMAGTDYDVWFVVAMIIGEDRPRIYRIDRNSAAERVMLRKAREWWERYIIGDERPPITASTHTDRWLKHRFPRHTTSLVVEANPEERALLEEYADTREMFDCAEKRKKDLEARIKAAIGERSGLYWPTGRFTWKRTRDSKEVNWQGLAMTLLERHPAGPQLLAEFTSPKPGSRRIHYTDRRGEEREIE